MRRTSRDLIAVGLFVLVAGSLLVGALLWIAGARVLRRVDTYTVLFEESVSGLAAGSVVEYQGVVVGRVQDITLTRDIPPKVAVVIDIEPGTPVRADTTAELLGSLVTGIQWIQLRGGSVEAGPLAPGGVMRGDATSMGEFQDQASEIARRVGSILETLDEEVFTPENSATINRLVADLGTAAQRLDSALGRLGSEEGEGGISELLREVSEIADNLNALIVEFRGSQKQVLANLQTTLEHIDETVTETRELVRGTQSQIAETGGSLGGLVDEVRTAVSRLQETVELIQSDPAVVIWGRRLPEREWEQ